MTVYSLEGIMVLVVVYTLGVAFLVFYLKWRKATAELKRLRHSFGDDLKANTTSPTVDTKPIIRDQIEPLSNTNGATAPMTTPPITLRRIPFASTIRAKLIKLHEGHQSIKSRTP